MIGLFCLLPNWSGVHYLVRSLDRAGIKSCVLTPKGSYIARSRFPSEVVTFADDLTPAALADTVSAFLRKTRPQIMLAGDDPAFAHLCRLADGRQLNKAARTIVERALPHRRSRQAFLSEAAFLSYDFGAPCRPPEHIACATVADITGFAAQVGYPLIAKVDGLWGGMGVCLCANYFQVAAVMQAHSGTPVSLMKFIDGRRITVVVAGVAGHVTGAFAYEIVAAERHFGPGSVMAEFDHPQAVRTAETIVASAGITGFACVDFIVDGHGTAFVLEVNPIPAPALACGQFVADLVTPFVDALMDRRKGRPMDEALFQTVALFPEEVRRDAASIHLAAPHHLVPRDDPEYLVACLQDIPVFARAMVT